MTSERDKVIMDENEIKRVINRIAPQIIESNDSLQDVVFIGILTRGVPFAERLASTVGRLEKVTIPVGILNIEQHRDDSPREPKSLQQTSIPFDIHDKHVVLVDDVAFSGRTTFAAMRALFELGRPQCIQLAVLVDRSDHRELPVQPDYFGRRVPTSRSRKERVFVRFKEIDGADEVIIRQQG